MCDLFVLIRFMDKIKKAVIPAAGLGTRFLPATKTVPKEMLPLVDRPILLYIVEECINSGIEDIVIIAGRGKSAIEDFFDVSYELEDTLERSGKTELLERIRPIKEMANIISLRQKKALGLGHAVACAQPVLGDAPFAVLLGDEVMVSGTESQTVTAQLIDQFEGSGVSTVSVMKVPPEDVSKYGIVAVDGDKNQSAIDSGFMIKAVVEKPELHEAPSLWALPGRYVFSAKIFKYLLETQPGKNGEIQLTDAMTQVAQTDGLRAMKLAARRYDAGERLGYLKATVELAIQRDDLGPPFRTYLQSLVKEFS